MTISSVEVRLIDIGWLFVGGNSFPNLAKVLNQIDSDLIFDTEFVHALLEVFWKKCQNKILMRIFLPYILYLALTFNYLVRIMNNDDYEELDELAIICGLLTCMLLVYLLITEYCQIKESKWKYFRQTINYFDLFQFLMNFFLISTNLLRLELMSDVVVRSISSLIMICMWMKMFDWLRMFDYSSKYISLIIYTLDDIMPFFIIFLLFLFMFGSAMFILN